MRLILGLLVTLVGLMAWFLLRQPTQDASAPELAQTEVATVPQPSQEPAPELEHGEDNGTSTGRTARGGEPPTATRSAPAADRIRGFVLDAGGNPQPQLNVLARQDQRIFRTISSAPAGEFLFDGMAAGAWTLEANHPDGRRALLELNLTKGMSVEDARLILPESRAGQAISGTVFTPKGEPASGAEVTLRSRSSTRAQASEQRSIRTDASGRFWFPFEAAGAQAAFVAELEAEWKQDGAVHAATLREIPAGTHDLRLVLAPVPSFRLRVVDAAGQPVTRFGYLLSAARGPGEPYFARSSPPAERPGGVEQIAQVPGRLSVLVESAGYQPWRKDDFLSEQQPELIAELERIGELCGVVVAEGKTIEGARVGLQRVSAAGQLQIDGLPAFMQEVFDELVTTRSNGEFCILPAARGEWHVTVRAAGFAATTTQPIACDPLPPQEPVVIELQRAATLEGTVRTAEGRAAADAYVLATNGVPPAKSVKTDEAGFYRITGLSPGEQWVVARTQKPGTVTSTYNSGGVPGAVPESSCRLDPGEVRNLDLVIEAGARVRVHITGELPLRQEDLRGTALVRRAGADGAAGAEWIVEGRSGSDPRTLEFEVPGTGRLLLSVHLSDELILSHEADLGPGTSEFELDVSGAPVEIHGANGAALPAMLMLVCSSRSRSGQEWTANIQAATRGQDRVRLDWLPFGLLREVAAKGQTPRSFEHRAGSALRIEW